MHAFDEVKGQSRGHVAHAQQSTRTPEDDARNIATIVVEGFDDSEMVKSFHELVLKLWVSGVFQQYFGKV